LLNKIKGKDLQKSETPQQLKISKEGSLANISPSTLKAIKFTKTIEKVIMKSHYDKFVNIFLNK